MSSSVRPSLWAPGLALLALLPLPLGSAQAKVSSKGEVALESRAFWPDEHRKTEDINAGVAARVELKGKQKPWREKLRLFARAGGIDAERSLVTVEEAHVGFRTGTFRGGAGAYMLNWTATEAFHPADVINTRNLDSDLESSEKLGEPMGWLGVEVGTGLLTAYLMPMRLEPLLPGPASRLSFGGAEEVLPGVPTDFGAARWVDADGTLSKDPWALQWAARISQTFGSADLALQYVEHNDRQQLSIAVDAPIGAPLAIRPIYHRVRHLGGTYVHALGEWLVKAEAAWRMFGDVDYGSLGPITFPDGLPDHGQVALGVEWGWEYESGHGATVLAEGQALLGPTKEERRQLHFFQRDALLGYRHTFNDVQSQELMVGLIGDLETWPEIMFNVSYQRRVGESWSLRSALRLLHAPPPDGAAPEELDFLQRLDGSHQLQLTLTRHF